MPFLIGLLAGSGSAVLTAAVGQASETDTAQPITWAPKRRLVNQIAETDTANAITARKTVTLGQPSETDTAQAVTARKTIAIGQPSETDTATALTVRKTVTVAQASEGAAGATIAEPFTYSDGDLETVSAGIWNVLQGAGSLDVISGRLAPVSFGGFHEARRDEEFTSGVYYAKLKIDFNDSAAYRELGVTLGAPTSDGAGSTSNTGYYAWIGGSSIDLGGTLHYEIVRMSNPSTFTSLTGGEQDVPGGLVNDAYLELRLDTNTGDIELYYDGVLLDTANDTTYTGGYVGVAAFTDNVGVTGDDFEGGDYGSAPGETAQPITVRKSVTVGQASESDTAQTISLNPQRRLVAQTSETDAAQAITARKTVAVGQVAETDTAQEITPVQTSDAQTIDVDQASETDTAQAITVRKTVALGQVSETDTGQAVTARKTVHIPAPEHVWDPLDPTGSATEAGVELGTWFNTTAPIVVYGARIWGSNDTIVNDRFLKLWDRNASGTWLVNRQLPDTLIDGIYQEFHFDTPVELPAGEYAISANFQNYNYRNFGLNGDVVNGAVTIPQGGGRYTPSTGVFPDQLFNDTYYYVDLLFASVLTETDTAQSTSPLKTNAIGQVSETDTAQPITALKTVAVGQASETDTAQPVTARKTAAVTAATESDTSQPLTVRKSVSVAQSTESDTAGAITARKTVTIGQASETDTANGVSVNPQRRLIGQASETDTAQPISVNPQRRLIGQASETDTANEVTSTGNVLIEQASETDLAQLITARKTMAVAQPSETDTAGAVTARKTVTVDQAQETDTANAITTRKTVAVGQASETDTAQPIQARKTQAVGQASETDTANAITAQRTYSVGQASETDTAQTVTWLIRRLVGQASEIDTAQPMQAQGNKLIPVGQVTETDTAQPITARKTVALTIAVETDTATTITRPGHVGQASETDTAQPITVRKTVAVGQAAESDTAGAITLIVGIAVGTAIETDIAQPITWAPKVRLVGQAVESDTAQTITPRITLDAGTVDLDVLVPTCTLTVLVPTCTLEVLVVDVDLMTV